MRRTTGEPLGKAVEIQAVIDAIDADILSGDWVRVEQNIKLLGRQKLTDEQKKIRDRKAISLAFLKGNLESTQRKIKNFIRNYELDPQSEEWLDIHLLMAVIQSAVGHYQAAEKQIRNISLYVDAGSPGYARFLLNKGCILRDMGKWDEAEEAFIAAYNSAQKDEPIALRAALACAEFYSDLQKPDVAVWAKRCMDPAPACGAWEMLCMANIVSALDLFRSGDYVEGLNQLNKYLADSEQLGFIRPRIACRLALTEAHAFFGDQAAARTYLRECKSLMDSSGESAAKYYHHKCELLWNELLIQEGRQESYLEALDRLEILLAVLAKYQRTPGLAPFWLLIGEIQVRLGNTENADRAYRKAYLESQKSGSLRLQAIALFRQAELEWSMLDEKSRNQSTDRNRILTKLSAVLELASKFDDPEFRWRVHYFRGKIFRASGEKYPETGEMRTAALVLAGILNSFGKSDLRNLYLQDMFRSNAVDILKSYLPEDVVTSPKIPQPSVVEKPQSAVQETSEPFSDLQKILDALFDIHSAQNPEELTTRLMRNSMRILNADRTLVALDVPVDDERRVYRQVSVQNSGEIAFKVPGKWLKAVRKSGKPVIYRKEATQRDVEPRSIVCFPLTYKKKSWGVLYIDRSMSKSPFSEDEVQKMNVLIQSASITFSILALRNQLRDLTDQFRKEIVPEFPDFIGNSDVMKDIFIQIQRVAPADVPVLISGETGTGKDLVAKTIHKISPRKNKPFVYLDCSAIPMTLLEAELFGIDKGIATGVESRIGLLEYADGGTVLLDEVADIPMKIQAKLLRVLQEREFEPVGSERVVSVDIRILSTTSRNLMELISRREFREDFYYRISGMNIVLPPLRKRWGDVVLLARTFLQKYNGEFKKNIAGFTPEALDGMVAYSWPGNVRELDHAIRKAVLFCKSQTIALADLALPQSDTLKFGLADAMKELELRAVREALESCDGDVRKAVELLEISQAEFDRITKQMQSAEEYGSPCKS